MSDTKQPQPLIPPLIVPPRTAARKLVAASFDVKKYLPRDDMKRRFDRF